MALREVLINVPTSIVLVDGKRAGFVDLFESLRQTNLGQILQRRARYNKFKDNVSNTDWEKALGPDANNFEHMRLLYGITRKFIENSGDYFTQYEKEMLLLSSIVHDLGEYKYGDIPAPKRTKLDEEREMDVLREVLDVILPHDEAIVSKVISTVGDRDSKLGRAFNAIERVGYVRTSLRAWREYKSGKYNGALEKGLFGVAFTFLDPDKETGKTTLENLINYSEELVPVKAFLSGNILEITEILDSPLNPKRTNEYFQKAKEAWLRYINMPLPLEISPIQMGVK